MQNWEYAGGILDYHLDTGFVEFERPWSDDSQIGVAEVFPLGVLLVPYEININQYGGKMRIYQGNKTNTFATLSQHKSNHTPVTAFSEITYPFPNFNGTAIEVWKWISYSIPQFIM